MAKTRPAAQPGVAVDAQGGAVIDPTANVQALSEASNKRQDDLRQAAQVLSDTKHAYEGQLAELRSKHNSEIGNLREGYQRKIQRAESSRLDSIRQVDREEVAKTAVAANNAITTLAKQTNDLAVTLAKQVTDTAAAAEARNSSQYSDTNKRLSALELALSEGKGKQTVSDPHMERLSALVEQLARAQAEGAGQSKFRDPGLDDMRRDIKALIGDRRVAPNTAVWIVGGAAFVVVIGMLVVFISQRNAPSAVPVPQVIYVPASPGTLIPSTPPAAAPPR